MASLRENAIQNPRGSTVFFCVFFLIKCCIILTRKCLNAQGILIRRVWPTSRMFPNNTELARVLDCRPERLSSPGRQKNITPQDLRKVVFNRRLGKDYFPRLEAGEVVFNWRPGKEEFSNQGQGVVFN